jgi:hypothetical protein
MTTPLLDIIADITESYKKTVADFNVSQFGFHETEEGEKIFLFEQNKLGAIDYLSFRSQLKEKLFLSSGQGLQVIGDSNPFSKSGHRRAIEILEPLLKDYPGFLLYGFTSNQHGGANGVVEDCLKLNSSLIAKVCANVVYRDSIKAIKEWECTFYEEIKNYLVVFAKEKDCCFGDDIELSDKLAEKLLCLEGGAISFCQLINTLAYHEKPDITLVYGIRDGEPWFSAAELLAKLKKANNIDDLHRIRNNYLLGKKLYDPSGKVPSDEAIVLKEKQINDAFAKLIETENSLEKLKNVEVEVYNGPKAIKSAWAPQKLWAVTTKKGEDQFPEFTRETSTLGCFR